MRTKTHIKRKSMKLVTRSQANQITNCLCTTMTLGYFIDPHRYLIQFLFLNNTLKVLFLHHVKFQQISSSHFDSKRLFHNLNTFLNNGFRVSITYTYFGLPRNFSEVNFVLIM